jgi:ABC-type phosphate/phosphonate transport system substrate-binding protein
MKKLAFIVVVLLVVAFACIRCNNAGGNASDDTKSVKYHADSTKDSVKVKDTIKVIEKRKTGQ